MTATTSQAGRGYLVCLEGIDGAGKTTAVAALGTLLGRQGVAAVVVDKNTLRFTSPYVDRHMRALRELIWGHSPDDPYLELGDLHWVHLQAAWYLAASRCAVRPLTEAGSLVLTDSWTGKFLAKLAMRPEVDLAHARSLFAGLPRPDLVVGLRIEPAVAAARKTVITASEAGNHEGPVARTTDGFVAYQRRVFAVLDEFGQSEGWEWLEVTDRSVEDVAGELAELLYARLPGLAPRNRATVDQGPR